MAKRFLTDDELEKESRQFRRNPVKQDTFKEFRNDLYKQGFDFVSTWNNAIKYARSAFNSSRLKYDDSISKIAKDMIHELIMYPSTATLSLVDKVEGNKKYEKLINAEIKIYELRTKEFFKKYGDNEFTLNGEKTTLNKQFSIYASKVDKSFTKDKMNDIINLFKHLDGEYLLAEKNGNYGKND